MVEQLWIDSVAPQSPFDATMEHSSIVRRAFGPSNRSDVLDDSCSAMAGYSVPKRTQRMESLVERTRLFRHFNGSQEVLGERMEVFSVGEGAVIEDPMRQRS